MGDYRAPRFLPLGTLPSEGSRLALLAAELGAEARAVLLRPIPETLSRRAGALEVLRVETRRQAATPVPHLLRVLDVVDLDDGMYAVEEYVDGVSLAELRTSARARERAVPPLVMARLLADACAGLDAVVPLPGVPRERLAEPPVLAAAIWVGFDGIARFAPGAAGWPATWPEDPVPSLAELLRDELAAADVSRAGVAPEALRLLADRAAAGLERPDVAAFRTTLLRCLAGGALAGPGYVKHLLVDLVPLDSSPRVAARRLRATLATLACPAEPEPESEVEPVAESAGGPNVTAEPKPNILSAAETDATSASEPTTAAVQHGAGAAPESRVASIVQHEATSVFESAVSDLELDAGVAQKLGTASTLQHGTTSVSESATSNIERDAGVAPKLGTASTVQHEATSVSESAISDIERDAGVAPKLGTASTVHHEATSASESAISIERDAGVAPKLGTASSIEHDEVSEARASAFGNEVRAGRTTEAAPEGPVRPSTLADMAAVTPESETIAVFRWPVRSEPTRSDDHSKTRTSPVTPGVDHVGTAAGDAKEPGRSAPRARRGAWPLVAAALGGAFLTLSWIHFSERPSASSVVTPQRDRPLSTTPSATAPGFPATGPGPASLEPASAATRTPPPGPRPASVESQGAPSTARSVGRNPPKRVAPIRGPVLPATSLASSATVEIRAPAGSAVEIDGIHRGIAPLAEPLPLTGGTHSIRVTKGRGVYTTRLNARAGEDYTLDVTFVGDP